MSRKWQKKKENTDNKEVLGEKQGELCCEKLPMREQRYGVASAQEKFQIKLRELLALAKKKKKQCWSIRRSATSFPTCQLDAVQFEKDSGFP